MRRSIAAAVSPIEVAAEVEEEAARTIEVEAAEAVVVEAGRTRAVGVIRTPPGHEATIGRWPGWVRHRRYQDDIDRPSSSVFYHHQRTVDSCSIGSPIPTGSRMTYDMVSYRGEMRKTLRNGSRCSR